MPHVGYHYSHFTAEKTKAWRGLRSYSSKTEGKHQLPLVRSLLCARLLALSQKMPSGRNVPGPRSPAPLAVCNSISHAHQTHCVRCRPHSPCFRRALLCLQKVSAPPVVHLRSLRFLPAQPLPCPLRYLQKLGMVSPGSSYGATARSTVTASPSAAAAPAERAGGQASAGVEKSKLSRTVVAKAATHFLC